MRNTPSFRDTMLKILQAHTKANMQIAISTKKDGSRMKSIALLTMVFLPATFVAVSPGFHKLSRRILLNQVDFIFHVILRMEPGSG